MVVSYQFKNEKTWYKIETSHAMKIIDVKNHIENKRQIKSGTMLKFQNIVTGEEFNDDNAYIPRDASLYVRRIPRCALLNPILLESVEVPIKKEKETHTPQKIEVFKDEDEIAMARVVESALASFRQRPQSHQPQPQPQQRRVHSSTTTPPLNYICHRCSNKGHYIQHCPTNGDPTFDIKIYKNPTGIPKTFLSATDDESAELMTKDKQMYHSNPNKRSYAQFFERHQYPQQTSPILDKKYQCPICNDILKSAFFVSCCFMSFCEECIKQLLVEEEAVCPVCMSFFTQLDLHENFILRTFIAKNQDRMTTGFHSFGPKKVTYQCASSGCIL